MNSLDPWRVIVTDSFGDVVWPRPFYGHPFYQEIPSWIHYGEGNGTTRHLFDGAFIGADYAGADTMSTTNQRTGLTAEIAPIVAPATGGITVKKELDDKQILRVEICVDGKCYRTQMDLAPAIAMVMERLAKWHRDMHVQMDQKPSPPVVVGAVESAIGAAGDAMVDMLVGRHVAVMTGGIFDDIGGALSGIGSAVGGTLRTLAPVIAVAATGVATAYGGPAAGAAAGQLVPMVTGLAANLTDPKGDPAKKAAAQQAMQRVNQVAASHPVAAQALTAAKQAVKNTAVAYHVQGTAQRAAAGDAAAQADIQQIAQAAEQGDPAAKSTADLLAKNFTQELIDRAMHSQWGAQLWEKATGRGPATVSSGSWPSYAVVGSFWDDAKNAVLTVTGTKATNQFIKDNHLEPYVKFAAQAVATYYGGPAAGAAAGALSPMVMNLGVEDKEKAQAAHADVQGVKAAAQQAGPQMAQAADLAHGAIDHTATAYHIAQIVRDAKAGNPQAQQALANLRAAAQSGDLKARRALHAAHMISRAQAASGPASGPPPGAPPGAPPGGPPVGEWYDIAGAVVGCVACETGGAQHNVVGSAVDDLRERARAYAAAKPGNAAGVIQTADNRFSARGFPSLDDAIGWLQRATFRRGDFIYAAAYEKDRDGAAYIQEEDFGSAQAPTAMARGVW